MGFNKERERLQQIIEQAKRADTYNEVNANVIHDCYQEYAKVIAILYKAHANVFGNCYNYDRIEIRGNKKFLKDSFSEEARAANFTVYRDSLVSAAETASEYIDDFV